MSERGVFLSEAGGQAAPATLAVQDTTQQILKELPFLRRVVRRWHRAGADAEDLVQDTILQALANHQQWQPGTNLRAWLFTIMRNRFLADRARSERARVTLRNVADANHDRHFDRPEVRLMLRDVDRAIQRLPRAQAIALTLVGIEGKSYEEVARAMGLSVDAIRCHLSRARAGLRKAVDARDDRAPWARQGNAKARRTGALKSD